MDVISVLNKISWNNVRILVFFCIGIFNFYQIYQTSGEHGSELFPAHIPLTSYYTL